jgi:hypothetical protein
MRSLIKETNLEKLNMFQLNQTLQQTEAGGEKSKKGIMGRFMGSLFGSSETKIEKQIKISLKNAQINQALLDSLFQDYSEINEEERIYKASTKRSCRNLLDKSAAIALICYGVYKVLMTIVNLYLGRKQPKDPISNALSLTGR